MSNKDEFNQLTLAVLGVVGALNMLQRQIDTLTASSAISNEDLLRIRKNKDLFDQMIDGVLRQAKALLDV